MEKNGKNIVEIIGAGPAGLSAALSAHAAGDEVVVFEKRSDVGARFQGDFQGLENWTSDVNVLEEFKSFGINPSFDHTPINEIVCFDPDGSDHTLRSTDPCSIWCVEVQKSAHWIRR